MDYVGIYGNMINDPILHYNVIWTLQNHQHEIVGICTSLHNIYEVIYLSLLPNIHDWEASKLYFHMCRTSQNIAYNRRNVLYKGKTL